MSTTTETGVTASAPAPKRGTVYTRPGEPGSLVTLKSRYDNFIGGEWVAPTTGDYGEDLAPATGQPFAEYARSGVGDV
ncbi:MAG: aldehyde dehydrogenase, partial [Demequina sp.]|nr:aldehyde dehydrogenase [Demequina sp.]